MEINHNCHKFILINPTKFAFEQQPIVSWAFQKIVNQIGEKKKMGQYKDILSINYFRFMKINDCTNCFVELHSHTWDFFYLQGSKCSYAQRSKLVLENNVPSWPNARKLHKKKMTMVMNIMFVVFIMSLLQENIKQTIATHFLLLQKKH